MRSGRRAPVVAAAMAVLVVIGTTLAFAGPASAAPEPIEGLVCDGDQPDDDSQVSTELSPGEKITSYDIAVTLDEDGGAMFRETITYDFFGAKHGIFRDVVVRQRCTEDYDRVYPFALIGVSSPSGAPAQTALERPNPVTTDPWELINFAVNGSPLQRVRIGDPDQTITGSATYEIEFRQGDVVNGLAEHDELYWNVIGNGWGVPIENITVSVQGPAPLTDAACFAGATGSRSPCTSAEVVDGTARYTQTALGPHQNLTIVTTFPKGLVGDPLPVFEERWSIDQVISPSTPALAGAAALSLLLVVGFVGMAWTMGRDRQLAGSHVDVAFAPVGSKGAPVPLFADDHSPVEFVPPDGIRPGQLGVLIDEVAHPVDVTATVVDLAVRGYLRIEPIDRKWRKDDFELTRLGKPTNDLLSYESKLLNGLIASSNGSKKLSDIKNTFAADFKATVDKMYDDAVSNGWFLGRPDKIRRKWKALGWVLAVLSIAMGVALGLFTDVAVLALPVLVAGMLLIFGSRFLPRRTAAGTGLVRRCKGFEEFIRDSEAPRAQWAENKNIFSEYLPYAVVLGCADKWAATFEDLGEEALGDHGWYAGHSFTPHHISSSMSSFNSVASTSLTSTPASSGSGGGGSSGGGGGGGGGGSW